MGWFEQVKAYVWDDRTTPYLVPVRSLTRPQADMELFSYTVFLGTVFAAGTFAALVQAKTQQNELFYYAAAYCVSIVWGAIYLGFTKHPGVARYCVSAPAVAFAAFVTGTLNANLVIWETLALGVFGLLWLRYSLRVWAIARAYEAMSPQLPPDLPEVPPSRRRRRLDNASPPDAD